MGKRVRSRIASSKPAAAGAVAAAALKIMRGEIRQSDVLPPEACLEPMPFFAEVTQHGLEQPPDGKLFG